MSETTSGVRKRLTRLCAISDGGIIVKRRIRPVLHAASSAPIAPTITASLMTVALRRRMGYAFTVSTIDFIDCALSRLQRWLVIAPNCGCATIVLSRSRGQ